MPPSPRALPPALPSELLTYILSHNARPITLIICQSRATFLSSLQHQLTPRQPATPPEDEAPSQKQPHPLLIPTLRQIATSRSIKLVFIPTVSHLRAYLAVSEPERGKETPLLVVYGLVELHRDTSEWSAQGLGNSVAGLVEAAWRGRRELVVVEEREVVEDGRLDAGEEEEGRREGRSKVWEQRVPMLNGSVRRAGMESEDAGWSGRTVEVGRILGRWFKFERRDWQVEKQ